MFFLVSAVKMKKKYVSFFLILHSEMTRRERVVAEAAESRKINSKACEER